MKNALLQRRLDDFGDLLHCAWESKKKLSSRISNPRIDEMYAEARKAGALGGKMTGAGGGGCMLFYCHFEKRHKVAEVLRRMGATPTEFAFDTKGLQTWRLQETRYGRSEPDPQPHPQEQDCPPGIDRVQEVRRA
jgi:D-glycero-alpha-D-manno-heptose-7-phosphate kinase